MAAYGAVAGWRPVSAATRPGGLGVRLTRRGRLARFLLVAVVVVMSMVTVAARITGGPARAGESVGVPPHPTRVVVQQGDSLWTIAVASAPEADPRDLVVAMRELNGLGSNLIQPGQVLLVPSRT